MQLADLPQSPNVRPLSTFAEEAAYRGVLRLRLPRRRRLESPLQHCSHPACPCYSAKSQGARAGIVADALGIDSLMGEGFGRVRQDAFYAWVRTGKTRHRTIRPLSVAWTNIGIPTIIAKRTGNAASDLGYILRVLNIAAPHAGRGLVHSRREPGLFLGSLLANAEILCILPHPNKRAAALMGVDLLPTMESHSSRHWGKTPRRSQYP
jgi:hypothetical protein